MSSPNRRVHKKVIHKQSAHALRRKKAPKPRTKAEIRKEFFARTERIVSALGIVNRVPAVAEKVRHLQAAISELEPCVSIRSGNHLLRNQLRDCQDLLYELEQCGERSSAATIEILFVPELFRCCGQAAKRKAR